MRDMFDCLEETWNYDDFIYLTKVIKNKKKSKSKINYLTKITELGETEWSRDKKKAIIISGALGKEGMHYKIIKKFIRKYKISCQIYRKNKYQITELKPTEKETWWGRIKVWFFRKVQHLEEWIPIVREIKKNRI